MALASSPTEVIDQTLREVGLPYIRVLALVSSPSTADASFNISCERCGEFQGHQHGYLLPLEAIANLIKVFASNHRHASVESRSRLRSLRISANATSFIERSRAREFERARARRETTVLAPLPSSPVKPSVVIVDDTGGRKVRI